MPGLFGALGPQRHLIEELRKAFEEPWGHGEHVVCETWGLGGHAFRPSRALTTDGGKSLLAVDGEPSLYSSAQEHAAGSKSLFERSNGHVQMSVDCRGSIAVMLPNERKCFLACDWSGTFSIYYLATPAGLMFCSRQRPLARVLGLKPDPLGCLEFLKYGYTLRDRTHFQGLKRLLPGQILAYDDASKKIAITEDSVLWAEEAVQHSSRRALIDACWDALTEAVRSSLVPKQRNAILLSGGWDSRTLFAAALAEVPRANLVAYCHGDLESSEIEISRSLANSADVAFQAEPIDKRSFDPDFLRGCFETTEDVRFPWFHVAGKLLAQAEAQAVTSGVYGEVLGGHYGVSMILGGTSKAMAVGKALLGVRNGASQPMTAATTLINDLHLKTLSKPFSLSRDFWDSLDNPTESVKADLDWSISRLRQRGVNTADGLIEAFVTEHRGTQYINAQIRSCRSTLDIALPLVDRNLLRLACRIPIQDKIHNTLSKDILLQHASGMLGLPCAATLVPASYPILVHEAGRVIRRILEQTRRKAFLLTDGRVSVSRFGWVNFEFLRRKQVLRTLQEASTQPIWDRQAIGAKVSEVESGIYQLPLDPLAMVFLANHNLDLMVR